MSNQFKPSIELCLAVSGATLAPGATRTHREIAAFCECSFQMIYLIEQKALMKLRTRVMFLDREIGEALRECLTSHH